MKFFSLASRNLKEVYRDPVSLLLGLTMPVVLLILFSSIQKNIRLEIFSPQYLTPGVIVFSFAFLIMFTAVLLAKDRHSSFLVRLFTTPLKPSDYILAYLLPFIPFALMQTVICFLVGLILGATLSNIFGVLLLFIVLAMCCISLGVIMGSLLTLNQVSGVGSLLITAIGLFSGAWMDLNMIGGIFKTIGYALPFVHAVDASRALLTGQGFAEIVHSFYIILAYSLVFFGFAIISFKRAMNRL